MDEAFAMVKDVTVTRCDRLLALVGCGLDVNARCGPHGNTLLHEACCGNKQYVKPLLDSGANPNARNRRGSTAAYFAVGHLPTLQQLAAVGADLNTWPFTLLGLLCTQAHRERRRYTTDMDLFTIRWLVKQPSLDLDAIDCQGQTADIVAQEHGLRVMEFFIDRERAARKRWSILRAGWVAAVIGRI
jgi:hypothetical protein